MTRPKYLLTVPRTGRGKQVTAVSVKDEKELARRLEQANKAGVSASFKKLK
ncbi:MAG: hypothetical protein ACRDQZ_06590 [Mycobacteriales bacterium]